MYRKQEISYSEVPQFSERDKAYQRADERLRPFYEHEVNIQSFEAVLNKRRMYDVDRSILVEQLLQQYEGLEASKETLDNIHALSSKNTFTVITAHQPSLLTGPLYFIYKICSIISLARRLTKEMEIDVVPVFIMGAEDHDFEEIATTHLFGQDFTWQTDQIGSTGRMNLDGLKNVLDAIQERLGENENALDLKNKITSAFEASQTYGQFMFRFVESLFGQYGLIIANMDNGTFKQRLLPLILRDLAEKDSQRNVIKDQEAIVQAGFKAQAHAREVNIFWLGKDRLRVIDNGDGNYSIGEEIYCHDDLIKMLKAHPENISPNVILRPVYQELIMPNLAYIGGGGELAYWLERKSLFENWELPYPMLIRRDSFKIIDKKTNKWIDSSGLGLLDLFGREEQIIGKFTHLQSDVDIDLSEDQGAISKIFEHIQETAKKIDPTLAKTVASERAKSIKSLDYLASKMLKAEKQKNEVAINKLKKMKQKFFPGNDGLQERYDNFIPYYLRYGQTWIEELITQADPLNKSFKILIEE